MKLSITGKTGALTDYIIEGAAKHIDQKPFTGYYTAVSGNDIVGTASKKDIAILRNWADSLTESSDTKPVKKSYKSRRVVTLKHATDNNLNHGKSWTASGYDVDRHQLNPWDEGEKICYIYE